MPANHLVHETSPYLLQHAHNPVEWYPWGEEALNKAKKENKPILVSIGYSACHWCHVMERESFEDRSTAAIMNKHFVNIKIDREERPDLDHIYMDAVQAMTGSGGWPLNIFLTPDKRPFYGGTYFPPQRAFNRPSWQEVLLGVLQAFNERRHEIDAQAENLTDHLQKSNAFGLQVPADGDTVFTDEKIHEAFQNIMKVADKEWGGFGKAPKFPQTFSIQFLLRYYYFYNEKNALDQALLSLDKMIQGGIYDHIGGGFARYSTDTEWLVPHFEKMLYDNALLVAVLSEAYQLTGNEKYKDVLDEAMLFIQRELTHDEKGFYSALDADSEGEEGKYYVWSKEEVNKILGKESDIFCGYFDISETGNWESKNIPWVRRSVEQFAASKNISVEELKDLIRVSKEKLLIAREKRIKPLLDDKIILGWNALMNTACSKAYCATGNESYKQLAIDNMNFLLGNFKNDSDEWLHTWKKGVAKYPAFLDDYAFLIEALLRLQEISGDQKWLEKAYEMTELVIRNFQDAESGLFFYTKADQQDVIVRKKEIYDGAVPSGNSVMAQNLCQLSVLSDRKEWFELSKKNVAVLEKAIVGYPSSFGNWMNLFADIINGLNEVVVAGFRIDILKKEILQKYIPNKVFMASKNSGSKYPLLADKPVTERPAIFLCRNYTCHAPVFSTDGLIALINKGKNR